MSKQPDREDLQLSAKTAVAIMVPVIRVRLTLRHLVFAISSVVVAIVCLLTLGPFAPDEAEDSDSQAQSRSARHFESDRPPPIDILAQFDLVQPPDQNQTQRYLSNFAELVFRSKGYQERQAKTRFTRSNDLWSFDATAKSSEEILNEIANFGLDQSRYLHNVKEKKIFDEGLTLSKSDPAHFVAVFNWQAPRSKELSKYGYASLQASSLLSRQLSLTRRQIVYDLERVELRSTDLFKQCPFDPEADQSAESVCSGIDLIYRTANGICNNLAHPDWGASFKPLVRFLPPDFSDGVSESRVSVSGNPLPNPRKISTSVHRDSSDDTPPFTMMVMQWGQILDHDLSSTPMTRGFNHSMIKCCSPEGRPVDNELRHPDCWPIEVPEDDAFYSRFNITCMEFVRSSPAPRLDCGLGPKENLNQLTSFIDGSTLYGSTIEEQRTLRLGHSGKLKYTELHFRKALLPPLENGRAENECRISTQNLYCFAAGDNRVNEQPGLTAVHTLMLREHNRVAKALSEINPHWEDERLFQESRKIVGAMIQHITFNEWLPVVLGKPVIEIFELNLEPTGYASSYNDSVNPSIANSFATAAFRFGHSLVRNSLSRCGQDFKELPFFVRLHREMNNPANIHNLGAVDRLLLGLTSKSMARRDEFIVEELTNHLFQPNKGNFGLDLAALNLQRGRDHGIPAYNVWREQCGLIRFQRWSDMIAVASPETIDRLANVYEHIDDVDLFSGAMAEKPVRGGIVGPTFACIIGQQFLNLKRGDRFWYENGGHPGALRLAQLHEIRKATLARLLCDNLDNIELIQPFVFLSNDQIANKRVACRGTDIPTVNLDRWRQEPSLENPEELSSLLLPANHTLSESPAAEQPDASFQFRPQSFPEASISERTGDFLLEMPRPLSPDQFYGFFDNQIDDSLFDRARNQAFSKDDLFY